MSLSKMNSNTTPIIVETAAELTLVATTVTAYKLPSTFDAAVVDGTTISFRGPGVTVTKGQVVSLGYDGAEDSTTTAAYQALSTPTTLLGKPTLPGPVIPLSSSSLSGTQLPSMTTQPLQTPSLSGLSSLMSMSSLTEVSVKVGSTSGIASATPTSTPSAAARESMSAGRMATLLGILSCLTAMLIVGT